MQISGVGQNAAQYQSMRATQQSQEQVQQAAKVNPSIQPAQSLKNDNDGDIDGKGQAIDVRI